MNSETSKICRLCLKMIVHNAFPLTEKTREQMWDILHLKLNLDITWQPVICNECEADLQRGCNFKITSLNADTVALPYNIPRDKNYDSLPILDDRVCPFCGSGSNDGCFIYLHETKNNIFLIDILQKHFWELNLNTPEKQMCCKTCFEILDSLSTFIRNCLHVEERIKMYVATEGTDNKGKVPIENLLRNEFKSKLGLEIGYTDRGVENEGQKNDDLLPEEHVFEIRNEFSVKVKDECDWSIQDSEGNIKSEEVDIKSEDNNSERIQNSSVKLILTCELCPYKTTYKHCLSRHMLRHKSASEVPLYQCPLCPFKTKYQSGASRHMLIMHRSESEIVIYKCQQCKFETKHKNSFTRHLLIHKDPAEVRVVKCEFCPYAAQCKSRLKQHTLTHKKPSELKMYKCNRCSYQSKRSDGLKQHMVTHMKNSEMDTFKCNSCSYEAKLKASLKKHLEIHVSRRLRRSKQFRCHMCKYDAKQKRDFKKHMRTHKVYL